MVKRIAIIAVTALFAQALHQGGRLHQHARDDDDMLEEEPVQRQVDVDEEQAAIDPSLQDRNAFMLSQVEHMQLYHSDSSKEHGVIRVPLALQRNRELSEIYHPMLNLAEVRSVTAQDDGTEQKAQMLAQSSSGARVYGEVAMNDLIEAMDTVDADMSDAQRNYIDKQQSLEKRVKTQVQSLTQALPNQMPEIPSDVDRRKDLLDSDGAFLDQPSQPISNVYEDEPNKSSFRSELANQGDVSYLGPIFVGLPKSQGAMVVYDTGSDWLTIKAAITEQHANKIIDKEATAKKLLDIAQHKGYNVPAGLKAAAAGGQQKAQVAVEHLKRPKKHQMAKETPKEDDADTDNDGDGISKPFSNPDKEKKIKDKKALEAQFSPVMKIESVYNVSQSSTAKLVINKAFPLSYGSADLQGFKYSDTVCLGPVVAEKMDDVNEQVLKEAFCVQDFKLQAVVQAKGLDRCDGILGLSPKDYGRHSILPHLKRAGLIDRQLISFSNAFHESTFKAKYFRDNQSYMIFGGYNESQVVHGAQGMFNMPLADKKLNPTMFWGVEGQGTLYGDTVIMDPRSEAPLLSVIDSGTTLVILPYKVYDGLMMSIARELKHDKSVSFVCTRTVGTQNLGACYFNNTRCEDVTSKLKAIKFIFGNIVYEILPNAFLKDVADGGVLQAPPEAPKPGESYTGGCMFELRPSGDREDTPEAKEESRFLMGNTFLKNFVSVYDFDQQSVKLGVSVHSASLAKAYKYEASMLSGLKTLNQLKAEQKKS